QPAPRTRASWDSEPRAESDRLAGRRRRSGPPSPRTPARAPAAPAHPPAPPRGSASLHFQQARRVAVQDLRLVLWVELEVVDPFGAGWVGHERVIDGEEDPVHAHLHDA